MTKVYHDNIQVNVPVSTAYNQWTQFGSFPNFMDGVESVQQISSTMTHWKTKISGIEREFDAEIVRQVPDQSITWQSINGPDHVGTVSFISLDDNVTEVSLEMEYAPHGVTEMIGETLGIVERNLKKDLEEFKEFIESRGQETGSWRGEVDSPVSEF